MSVLSHRILATLAYHSIFDYPLTVEEIHRYLISDSPVSLPALKEEINHLLKTGKISSRNGFFIPSSLVPRPLSLVSLRQRRKVISQKKLIIAKQASRIISIIPWVKMIAVTGALAMENADENDDIDLMIVTPKNRLWLVRPLVILFISFFFKRRKPLQQFNPAERDPALRDNLTIKQFSNSICLNLWLDESALEIPVDQQSLYAAHELAQMKPIVNKERTYENMLIKNKWGEKFLANFWSTIQQSNPAERDPALRDNLTINHQQFASNSLLNLLNLFLFHLQFAYMKPKMTNERVSLQAAFFHPVNRADTILKAYDRLRFSYT